MKMFLLEMNKRRNSKIYKVIVGGRIVNGNFIHMWSIILSIEHCSIFLSCVLGHPGYNWALLILWNSLFPLFLSHHSYHKHNSCPACLRGYSEEQMTKGFLPENTTHLQGGLTIISSNTLSPQNRKSTVWIISTFLNAAISRGSTQALFYLNMYPNLTEITLIKY